MTDNDETISVLNDLIETCKDGEYGFHSSAQHVRNADLRELFEKRAAQCRQSADELRRHVVQLGGNPEDDGSVSGAVHRGWVALRGALSGYSDLAMLEECERGEDAALESYTDALQNDLPPAIRTLVMTQYEGVRRNHDQIRNLRDRHKATV